MKIFAPEPGRLVYSRQGRDRGRSMLILSVADEQYVLVVDGSLRKLEKPKKKKLMHLHLTPFVDQVIAEKLSKNQPVLDAEIRKAIQQLTETRQKHKEE